jgi:ATP-binding cassette, subfamily B, bacterial
VSRQLEALAWPIERAGEALQALAAASHLHARTVEIPPAPARLDAGAVARFVEGGAEFLGIEAEPFDALHRDLGEAIARAVPAVLLWPGERGPHLLLLASGGRRPRLLAPDGALRRVEVETLRAALARPYEAELAPEIDRLLDAAEVPPKKRPATRRLLVDGRLGRTRLYGGWILREASGQPFRHAAARARVPGRVATLIGAHLCEYILYVASWALLGRGALDGRMDPGWLAAWLLLLLTSVPFRLLATNASGELALRLGALIKARLLAGALALEPEEIRREGAGQLLGRVLESNSVETLAIGGGLNAAVSTLELGVAAVIIGTGASGWLGLFALGGWLALLLMLARGYARARTRWTDKRMDITHDLVERMVGHRTRLVQERAGRWHDGEDNALGRYFELSGEVDRAAVWMGAWVPRGMLLVGLATLGPAFLHGHDSVTVAVSLGGVLLAYRALRRFVAGLGDLTGAAIGWRTLRPLFEAAGRVTPPKAPLFALSPRRAEPGDALVEAHDVIFRYRDRGEPVLRGCSLSIRAGERILLEGPSGSGKSTLGTLLCGLRSPESGLLLLDGLDRHTLGLDGWRRRVVAAPQFHENHVFVGTVSFNLLFGRAWPPSEDDMREAMTLCRELGLGPLLERMPSGLEQMVGEVGWQLSHGERSRLYIARALLQEAELVVLDESFAALDPETLQLAMECVIRRARTLVVIAHP